MSATTGGTASVDSLQITERTEAGQRQRSGNSPEVLMTRSRWALVVGASRGLGLGLAAELKNRSWNIVATVRDAAGERRLQDLARQPGGEVRIEHFDINDDDAVSALRRRLADEVFDLVFVNAGIALQPDDPARSSRQEAARIFLTNAVAPVRFAQAFLDRVREGPGIVAFMSSGLGSIADKTDDYGPLYSASKAALNSLTRSFTAALGGRRITVLSVAPGWVRTDMGGAAAPLSVEESVRGIADLLENRAGSGRHGFVDHRGRTVAW
jgi:NAD(P)-dependent dehydrogenase (short-subunit alcohol dehydrogenase family)